MSVLNFFPYVLEDDEDVAKVVKKQLKMKIEERIKQLYATPPSGIIGMLYIGVRPDLFKKWHDFKKVESIMDEFVGEKKAERVINDYLWKG
ncbi:MAG: hypothetical protein KAW82_03310 [Desulfurellaceae bacterium]|nr:hypothetical protein [Desulfurellaceae bacterium]